MSTTATPEQWQEIYRIRQKWIDMQTERVDLEAAKKAVATIWKKMGYDAPEVILVDGPISMLKKIREIAAAGGEGLPEKENLSSCIVMSLWHSVYAGWLEGGASLGVKYDQEKYDAFTAWCKSCPIVLPTEKLVIVSDRPIKIHWQNGLLHNESGPSIEFQDGFKVWSIEGSRVDEQIVMRPETQTLDQLRNESNADVKEIRIRRFGLDRFLVETKAKLIDERRNPVEGTREQLFDSEIGRVLLGTCPTLRIQSMTVPETVKTCEEAAKWLNPFTRNHKSRIIART